LARDDSEPEAAAEAEAEPEPTDKPRKKRRRKRKRSQKKDGEKRRRNGPTAGKKADDDGDQPSKWSRYLWVALVVAGVFELWLFGYRGHIEVCVGRQGEHDFALLGTPRNDDNTRRFPTCEKRLNIGITGKFDKQQEDAMIHACRRATILRGKRAALECAIGNKGIKGLEGIKGIKSIDGAKAWEHRTTTGWCPPWHDHYYKRLFWFLNRD
jgi:hypothetical protein